MGRSCRAHEKQSTGKKNTDVARIGLAETTGLKIWRRETRTQGHVHVRRWESWMARWRPDIEVEHKADISHGWIELARKTEPSMQTGLTLCDLHNMQLCSQVF